jgi:hypothetical protein
MAAMQQKAAGFMCATLLVACILSIIGLNGIWWGQSVEGNALLMVVEYDLKISLWNVKSEIKLAIDGPGASSSSEKSLDDLCEQVTDQSPEDQKEFCKQVVVIRVFSVLGLIAAAVSLLSSSLLVTSLQFGFPWKTPPSSSLLLVNSILAGCIVVFTLVSVIIAAAMKEDGFSSTVSGVVGVKSTDFGVQGAGFICNVVLLVVGVIALACGLASRKQVTRELPATQAAEAPTILGKMSNAVKGAQNV